MHLVVSCHCKICSFAVACQSTLYGTQLENLISCTAPPEIVVAPNQKTVLVGDQLTLTCEAVGTPKPSITWAKDDINLERNERIQVGLPFQS